jgi:hypothetical protein
VANTAAPAMAKAPMAEAVVEALMVEAPVAEVIVVKVVVVEVLVAEAAMECGAEQKERPGADEAAIWVRAVIRIAASIGVVVARGRRLDDIALTRHALAVVELRLRSSGDGAGIARADCGAGQQPGAGADRGPRTALPPAAPSNAPAEAPTAVPTTALPTAERLAAA